MNSPVHSAVYSEKVERYVVINNISVLQIYADSFGTVFHVTPLVNDADKM